MTDVRCPRCGRKPDVLIEDAQGVSFMCPCNTRSRLRRALLWTVSRWQLLRAMRGLPKTRFDDWDEWFYIKPGRH